MKKLGNVVFYDWKELLDIVQKWANKTFSNSEGSDVLIELTHGYNFANIGIIIKNKSSYDTFKAIYDKFDPLGEFDPKEDFTVNNFVANKVKIFRCFSELPARITFRIMASLIEPDVGFRAHSFVAGYEGIIFFENQSQSRDDSDDVFINH